MLSRVADSLYWFSRYLRRAENCARLVGVNGQLELDLPRGLRFAWEPLVETLGVQAQFAQLYPDGGETAVARFLLVDERNPSSMLVSLAQARDILRSIRETLPQEVWFKVNHMHLDLQEGAERGIARRYRHELLARVVDGCLAVSGILTANVSRDVGYQFLRLGTALEQADMTSRIIDAGALGLIRSRLTDDAATIRNLQWMSVLRSLEADQMFRRHARARFAPAPALRFLLQSRDFPRSVAFCLVRIRQLLPSLPHYQPVERAVLRALALATDADAESLVEAGTTALMDEIQRALASLDDELRIAYFRA